MFRKRSFFLAGIMTALVLTGCGGANTASHHATDTLLVDKLEGLESADFKTVVAQKGDLTKSVEDIRASLYFGEPQYLTYSVENVALNSAGPVTVTIVEFYGNAGSSFNAGEPILKINRRVDEIARIEAENELGSLRETYTAACADYEQRLSEEDVTSAAYHSLKKEYDSYMSGMEETLKRMEAELAFCDEAVLSVTTPLCECKPKNAPPPITKASAAAAAAIVMRLLLTVAGAPCPSVISPGAMPFDKNILSVSPMNLSPAFIFEAFSKSSLSACILGVSFSSMLLNISFLFIEILSLQLIFQMLSCPYQPDLNGTFAYTHTLCYLSYRQPREVVKIHSLTQPVFKREHRL